MRSTCVGGQKSSLHAGAGRHPTDVCRDRPQRVLKAISRRRSDRRSKRALRRRLQNVETASRGLALLGPHLAIVVTLVAASDRQGAEMERGDRDLASTLLKSRPPDRGMSRDRRRPQRPRLDLVHLGHAGPIKSWFRQHYFRREPPPAVIAADVPADCADCTRVEFYDFDPSVLVKNFNQVSIAPKVRIQDLTPQLRCSDGLVEGLAVTA